MLAFPPSTCPPRGGAPAQSFRNLEDALTKARWDSLKSLQERVDATQDLSQLAAHCRDLSRSQAQAVRDELGEEDWEVFQRLREVSRRLRDLEVAVAALDRASSSRSTGEQGRAARPTDFAASCRDLDAEATRTLRRALDERDWEMFQRLRQAGDAELVLRDLLRPRRLSSGEGAPGKERHESLSTIHKSAERATAKAAKPPARRERKSRNELMESFSMLDSAIQLAIDKSLMDDTPVIHEEPATQNFPENPRPRRRERRRPDRGLVESFSMLDDAVQLAIEQSLADTKLAASWPSLERNEERATTSREGGGEAGGPAAGCGPARGGRRGRAGADNLVDSFSMLGDALDLAIRNSLADEELPSEGMAAFAASFRGMRDAAAQAKGRSLNERDLAIFDKLQINEVEF